MGSEEATGGVGRSVLCVHGVPPNQRQEVPTKVNSVTLPAWVALPAGRAGHYRGPVGSSRWQEREFIEPVAAHHRCEVTRRRGGGDWELRATTGGIEWQCRLRPIGDDVPPGIRWLASSVRFDEQRPVPLTIARRGIGGDGGGWDVTAGGWVGVAASAAILGLGRLARRRAERSERSQGSEGSEGSEPRAPIEPTEPVSVLGPGWSVQDPAGVVDAGIGAFFAAFPAAWTGQADEPSSIDSVWLSNDGLEVASNGWWDSAAALDHQIRLGLALAVRVRTVRGY